MRLLMFALALLASGCATSSLDSTQHGQPSGTGYQVHTYALPRTMLEVQVIGAVGEQRLIEPTAHTLHSDRQFTIRYRASATSSDKIQINAPNGLLDSVSINRTDETADVINPLVSAVRSALSGLPSGDRDAEENSADASAPRLARPVFDPDGVLPDLSAYGLALGVEGACPTRDETPPRNDAIYYAVLTPRLLTVSRIGANGARTPIQVIPYSTTNCAVGVFDIGQFNWVESSLTLTMADGALVEVKIDKPSEAAAVAQIPLVIVDNVLGVARDLLTVRIQQIKDEDDFLDAQAGVYTSQAELLNAYATMITALAAARQRASTNGATVPDVQPPPPPRIDDFSSPGRR